jgi:ribokinase
LHSEGVDVSHVVQVDGIATGVALIVVDAHGENQIAVASGANSVLGAEAVRAALENYELSADGVLLIGFEVGSEAIEAAARWASASGHTIVLDPAPARTLTPPLVACSPVVKPNTGEAEQMTGESDPEIAARTLSRLTGSPAVITLGADGVLVADDDVVTRFDSYEVAPIDSTGAGDAFSGAFAVGLAQGLSIVEAVQQAQAAAAISIQTEGARTGMPDRETLDRFLAER